MRHRGEAERPLGCPMRLYLGGNTHLTNTRRGRSPFLFLDLMFTSWEILGKFLHLLRPQCYLQKGVNTYFAKLLRGSHEIVSGVAPLKKVSQEEVPISLSQGIPVGLGIPQPKTADLCLGTGRLLSPSVSSPSQLPQHEKPRSRYIGPSAN